MKISTILDKIDEHQLFVPAFQREYVWKRDDVKSLVDSLIKGYPTGTMLTWETNQPPEMKGSHRYDSRQGAVRLLLDGQQRVTSLYLLIRGEIPPYYVLSEIMNDTRGLHVNVETLEMEYYSRAKMEKDPLWENITNIFQKKVRPRDVVRRLEESGGTVERAREDLIDDNMRAIESILDREFPEQTIPIKATIREAIDIFYKVNASGVALTEAELALAQISGYWPQARDIFKKKISELSEGGFVFNLDFIVYALLGCVYHLGSDMRKLHDPSNNEKIREAWERLDTKVLDYVVNLLRSHAFVDHRSEINSVYALVPIIVYCFDKKNEHLDETTIKKMVKWFYYSQIRSRYISQLQTKLDQDLRIVAESSNPFDELLGVIAEERRLEIVPDEFVGHSTSHPLYGLMRWYFKSKGAICLTTGVELRGAMGRKFQSEWDHIFPYSVLKKSGYGKGNRVKYALAQEMTNRAILTQLANRSKSDSAANDYLQTVQDRFPNALSLQSIPEDKELWETESYEQFLDARRRMLASELNAFLEGITATEETAAPFTIEDLIASGESDELEFKSSLRWDFRAESANKALEDVIVKSVAAFTNAHGGTVLIGVGDDGEVLGLERDYATLNGADQDRYEVHLRNLLTEQFGPVFVATRLAIDFPIHDERDICQIDIAPATEAVFVRPRGDGGQRMERFYLRSGNTSTEIPPHEVHPYVQQRFG